MLEGASHRRQEGRLGRHSQASLRCAIGHCRVRGQPSGVLRLAGAHARSVTSKCVRPILVNTVVIRWVFRFEWRDGTTTRIEELAYQRWEGERIAEETFFYDPAQRTAQGL
jgi:hypothetical protein